MNRVSDMKAFVVKRVGNVTAEEALRELNTAWQEMWDSQDLPGCLESVLIKPEDGSARYLALPGFVGRIQGIRYAAWGPTIRLNYPTTYFQGTGPRWQSLVEWSSVDEEPLKRQVLNVSPLTFKVPAPLDEDIAITVVGNATGAERARETVTLLRGERSVTTSIAFGPSISSITKTAYCAKDITVVDKDDNELAVLGAADLQCRYMIVKLFDFCNRMLDLACQAFEVLYKKRCSVLFFDEDTVPAPHYVAVQNQAVASLLAARSGDGDLTRASVFSARAAKAVSAFSQAQMRGTTVRIDTGKNSMYSEYYGHL
jgi:hypothetical protein